MPRQRKIIIGTLLTLIIVLGLFSAFMMYKALTNSTGVTTEPLDASGASPASTDINGHWNVVRGNSPNVSSVGFQFYEILPGEDKVTAGTTSDVSGEIIVADDTLEYVQVTANMETIETDNQNRDVNIRRKLLHTDEYPEAYYESDDAVNLSSIPDDGSVGEVEVTGDLTVHGVTQEVTSTFQAVRDGDSVILSTTIAVNRLDFDIETPEFIAAKIAEEGEINVLLTLRK